MNGHNLKPGGFAAALAVVLMVLTSLMILVYRKVTHVKDLEGLF